MTTEENTQQKPTQDEDYERLPPVEIKMMAVALVAQMPMPMRLDDALAVIDYARFLTEQVFKA